MSLSESKAPVIAQNELNSEIINTDFLGRIIVCLELDKWLNCRERRLVQLWWAGSIARTICHFISHKMSSQLANGSGKHIRGPPATFEERKILCPRQQCPQKVIKSQQEILFKPSNLNQFVNKIMMQGILRNFYAD